MATPTITVAEFREAFAAYPQLLRPEDTLIDILLGAATEIVDGLRPALDPAGGLYGPCISYLCGHFLDTESGSRVASVGASSIDRDSLVRATDPLHSTRWGRTYLTMIAGRASTGGVGVFESPSP